MAGREGRTRQRRRMSGSTRVVQRPAQLFSAKFRYLLGKPMVGELEFRQGTEDLAKAFRQVPFHNDTLRYNVVCAWSPRLPNGSFSRCLPCSASRPLSSSSTAYQHWLRPWRGEFWAFLVWGSNDDFKHSELLASVPSARDAFTDLITWLGLITDPKKSQDPTAVVKFLGRLFRFVPHPERIQTARAELLHVRGVPVLHLGELARLRGKLIHLARTMAGRVGASLTYQCTYHITTDITTPSSALRREIDWVLALLARAPWRVVHLSMPHQGVTVSVPLVFLGVCSLAVTVWTRAGCTGLVHRCTSTS